MNRVAYAQAAISDEHEVNGMASHRIETLCETLRAVAMRKGRVIITPSLIMVERSFAGSGWKQVTARARTAARPGWRRRKVSS